MVGVSVQVDEAALKRISDVLERVKRESPGRLANETRRAALYICKSLKARTRKAPKKIQKAEWRASTSANPPRYAHSNSAGRPLLRRWTLWSKLGTPAEYAKVHFVYTRAHRAKNGKMVGKRESEEVRELLKQHGGIQNAGLAKASWGWAAKRIYNADAEGALMVAWRTNKWRRDPRRAVEGMFRRLTDGGSAKILNRLAYIRSACPPSAVAEAVDAASKRLGHNVDNYRWEVAK